MTNSHKTSNCHSICAQDRNPNLNGKFFFAGTDDCVHPEDALSDALRQVRLERLSAAGISFERDRDQIIVYLGNDDDLTRICNGRHAYAVVRDGYVVGVQLHDYRELPQSSRNLLQNKGYTVKDCPLDSIYMPGHTHAYRIMRRAHPPVSP